MRLRLLILFCVFSLQGLAQNNSYTSVSNDLFENGGVEIYGEGGINSTTFTGSFFAGLLDGRHYDAQTLRNITDRAGATNRLGFDTHTGFAAAFKLNKKNNDNLLFTLSAGFKTHFNSSYSADALDVFLNGNAAFAGREAQFDNLNATYLEYSQIKAGLHKKTASGQRFGVAIGLNLGRSMFTMDSPFARMYTHSNGNALRFNVLAEADYTSHSGESASGINGIGAGLDFYFEQEINLSGDPKNKGFLRFEVQDFGFITFNQNTNNTVMDTLYFYRGSDVGTFPNRRGEEVSLLDIGDARDLATETASNASKTVWLPFWLRVRGYQEFESFDVTAGTDFRVNAGFAPYVFTHVRKNIGKVWKAGIITGAGGYGTGNLGFSLHFENAGWAMGIVSQNVEGAVFSNSTGGLHGGVSIQKRFSK